MALAHLISGVRATVDEAELEAAIAGREVSELELLTKRRHFEEERRAQHHWSLLKDSITNIRRAVEEADIRDISLVHGIHHDRKLNHTYPIQHAIFIPQKKEYLTSDGETVWQFHEDGRKKEMVTPDEPMDRIIFAAQTNQYVGWLHKEDTLYLMNSAFEIKSQSQTVGRIHLGAYNNNTGEMITVGPGFITCWSFRYGARHLIPRKTTTTEFFDANMFSMMVLEETASRSQRIIFACANGVVVYNVYEGKLLSHRKELHVRPITAITFFTPLKYLITGAMDGCIKVWDHDWCIKMVFVGHSNAVSSLAIYPHGPLFISASKDCTVRVWSMETCDEVDKTSIAEPVQGLYTSPKYDVFFTFAGKKVDLWRLNHLYHIHTNIGHRVNTIKLTTHPFHPVRAVLMGRDSSVRIVSPAQGEVLTTLVMPSATGLIDAAYAVAEDTMFTVCGNGDIIKCKTDVNPCEIVARWRCPSFKEVCSCLLVYEYVIQMSSGTSIWDLAKRNVATKTTESRNRTLLLGGRKDGYICVYNWETGNVDFKVEAHGSKGVLNMIANSKLDQLVTAGMDNIIKVWRLYPFAEEALAPLMSFYCAHTPAYMSTIKSSLCVAFQDPATATFNIVLYNLPEKKMDDEDVTDLFSDTNRHDHKPDDDHVDLITGLTSCARMKLYASSSMDGSIRIWNDENKLVRVLRLNAIPNSIGFCSSRGDLLVGIGLHLFHIPWYRYLPKPYLRKMVSMRFVESKSEEAIPYDEDRLKHMDKNDVKRLKGSHASFKVTHFEDELSKEEENEVMREKRIREKAFNEIEVRENELGLIRDGGKSASKKPKTTKRTQKEALKNFIKMFYNKERITIPADDPFPQDTLKQKMESQVEELEDEYRPETAPINFFQEVNRNRTPGSACHGISPMGFVPNSVMVKILYPPPSPPSDSSTLRRPYRPPVLSAKQLSEIKALKKSRDSNTPRRSVTFAEREESFDLSKRTLELDLDEEEEKTLEVHSEAEESVQDVTELSEREKTAASSEMDIKSVSGVDETDQKTATPQAPSITPLSFPPTPARSQRKKKKKKVIEEDEDDEDEDVAVFGGASKSGGQSSLMNKFKDIMDKPPSPKPKEEEVVEAEAAAEAKPPEEKPKPAKVEFQQPLKPIKKLVSRPRLKLATPPPPKSPTPPPPATPLPDFIKQFIGTEWFEKYFPNCNDSTMPKPWSGDHFVNMVMKLLRFASFPHKTCVAEAITLVHTQEILSEVTCHAAQKMLLTALNHHTQTPSCAEPEQKTFILAGIKSMQSMGICDKDFVVEMLVQFLDGDREVRTSVLDILNAIGLQDPHRQMQKELDSWDIWNMEEPDRKKDLKKMCSQWLDRWMTSYKLHIKDAVERLQKGQNLHGRLRRGSMAPRGSIAAGSRRGSVMPGDSETVTSVGGGDYNRPPTRGSMTFAIERPDMALADHATYFEAMNYFCEMMTEKELEALRRGEILRRGAQDDQVVQAKNTVLVLPKIAQKPALVRLGETHTSQLRQSREAGFSIDYQQISMLGKGKQPPPGQLTGFVPCINLPMKAVYLNPFPSPIDALDAFNSQPILITLKSSQKYFIPSQSIVPREMLQVAPSS